LSLLLQGGQCCRKFFGKKSGDMGTKKISFRSKIENA
jgi:hypothetical protein